MEDAKIVDLQVIEVVQNGQKRSFGRPLALTARCFIRICRAIEEGTTASDACRLEGVTYQIFRKRVGQYASCRRRLAKAEEIRQHFLREYHIANITQHSRRSVIASMWWLERNYPNEFALRTVVRDTNNSAEPLVCERISIEQLVENARLAKQIADTPPPGLSGAPAGQNGVEGIQGSNPSTAFNQ
jgi:hypothetical protein